MHHSVIIGIALAASFCGTASAHAVFPGRQTVQTFGDRAFVQLHAVNGRKDVSNFVVEIFDYDWTPSKLAVATPKVLNVPAQNPDEPEAIDHPISVLVDLDGKKEQRLRVCTKSVPDRRELTPKTTELTTRVCANVTVQRFQR